MKLSLSNEDTSFCYLDSKLSSKSMLIFILKNIKASQKRKKYLKTIKIIHFLFNVKLKYQFKPLIRRFKNIAP